MAINQYTGAGGRTGDPYGESDQFTLASQNTDGAALIYGQDNINVAPAGSYYMARMLFFEAGEHRIEAYGCDGVEIRVDDVTVVLRGDASQTYEPPATAVFNISRRNAFRLDAIYRKAYPRDEEGNLVDGYDRSGWVAFVIYDPRGAAVYHSNDEFWVWGRNPVPDDELSYGGGLDPNADDRLLLPAWVNQPNWEDGILETLEWKTWIGESESGAEQRAAQRRSPRRMIEARFTSWAQGQAAIHNAMLAAGRHKQLVPLWMHRARTTEDLPEQAVTIKADYRLREFKAGGLAIIRDPEELFVYEVVVIETLSDTEMSITIPLQREWPRGSVVEPLRVCRILDDPTLSQRTSMAVDGSVRFTQEEPETQRKDVSIYPTHPIDGLPILGLDNNWREDSAFGFQRPVYEFDNQAGVPVFFDVSNQSKRTINYRLLSRGRSDLDRLKSLLAYLSGRRNIAWLPTLADEVEVIETIDPDVAEVVVKKAGLTLYGASLQDTRRHIMFEMANGEVLFNQLISTRARPNAEVMVLADNFSEPYAPEDFAAIRFLSHARLAKDTIELQHHTDSDGVREVALPFVLLSNLREVGDEF